MVTKKNNSIKSISGGFFVGLQDLNRRIIYGEEIFDICYLAPSMVKTKKIVYRLQEVCPLNLLLVNGEW